MNDSTKRQQYCELHYVYWSGEECGLCRYKRLVESGELEPIDNTISM